MKPENITIAIREILTEIDASPKPANEILNTYTRARRYIGSKDRRAICDGVWAELRKRPWPKWLDEVIPEEEKRALRGEAQSILRANGDRDEIRTKLLAENIETELTQLSPLGLILKKRIPLMTCKAYLEGKVEVQDEVGGLLGMLTSWEAVVVFFFVVVAI